MIIELTAQKYKVGCGKGLDMYEEPNLLDKLNYIIEWDFCKMPVSLVETVEQEVDGEKLKINIYEEDKNRVTELKVGDTFLFNGQVFAIDSEERIVLVVSGTGRGALGRFIEEVFHPEYKMMYGNRDVDVDWELHDEDRGEFDTSLSVPYIDYRIWRDRFVAGREDLVKRKKDNAIQVKATVKVEGFLLPIEIILGDWEAYYRSDEFDDEDREMLEEVVRYTLANFVRKYERLVNPIKPTLPKDEQIKVAIEQWKNKKKRDS